MRCGTLWLGCGAVWCGVVDRVRAKGQYGFEIDFDTGIFNPNIPIFPPNSAEGLHFSAFH